MVRLICEHSDDRARLSAIAEKWQIVDQPDAPLALVLTSERLELRKLDEPKLGAIYVDFVHGALAHRRRFGGGRGEAIAKAVGIKKGYLPTVVDATAGLGRDAFVLAAVGCRVIMLERHPVVAALLMDGLERGYQDSDIGSWLKERLQLDKAPNLTTFMPTEAPQVVYLDPMFPHRQKSALVKKEMRVFQQLVGADMDADTLLMPACQLAEKRVVVKRPNYAPYLNAMKPSLATTSKNHRFDIYLTPEQKKA